MAEDRNITIKTGLRVVINEDPGRVIEFDPLDVLFVERFYALVRKFDEQEQAYKSRIAECVDDPQKAIDTIKDFYTFLTGEIDNVFGAGTSQKITQGAMDITALEQFFDGIIPIVEQSRAKKVKKYMVK